MPLVDEKQVSIDDRGPASIFTVPEHYRLVRKIGTGAYGKVASFKDSRNSRSVAVKKIADAFNDLIDGKRILREVKLLAQFEHENIIKILDIFPPPGVDFDDIYIVTDLMETDLHKVIYSKQALSEDHAQYFVYQVLRGMLYIHSCGVLHRDLKPANILLNKNCDLKICDFGLARGMEPDEDDPTLTDYVVTRWYRAPEVVLSASEYTYAIDVWSVGCILAEILGRKPLFNGTNHLDQIKRIIEKMGYPSKTDMEWLDGHDQSLQFLQHCPRSKGTPLSTLYPQASEEAIDLLKKMLEFDPHRRITVKDAIASKFMEEMHAEEDEPVAGKRIDWSFDHFEPTRRLLQNHIYLEALRFHPDMAERDKAGIRARPELVKMLP